jgi:hypothetical protein
MLASGQRKLKNLHAKIRYQETSSENYAEEQPLLRPITKQRLVKADLEDVLCY